MRVEHRLPGVLEAPAQSRRLVERTLGDHPRLEDIVLASSELVANAVVHGRDTENAGMSLGIAAHATHLRVWVVHRGNWFDPRADRGVHGLGLVDRIADRWGIGERDGSVTVWFEVDSPQSDSRALTDDSAGAGRR
jgi:anti-sigma regulatory factor (Ser/Thr protein kinase)